MKKLIPLAALALTYAPLQAASPQETLTALVQHGQIVAPADIQARAAAMPALAYLPADSECVIELADINLIFQSCVRVFGGTHCVRDAALSLSKGSLETLGHLFTIAENSSRQNNKLRDYYAKWDAMAKPELGEIITQSYVAAQEENAAKVRQAMKSLESGTVAPLYLAITAEPGKEDEFAGFCDGLIAFLSGEDITTGEDGWMDVKFPLPLCSHLSDDAGEKVLHLRVYKGEKALIVVLCEKPESVALPASVEESLAASTKLQRADAHLGSLVASVWLSPEGADTLLRVANERSSSFNRFVETFGHTLGALAAADTPDKETYASAVSELKNIAALFSPDSVKYDTPVSLLVWKEGDKNFAYSFTTSAMGAQYEAGTLRHTAEMANDDTILYIETTPVTSTMQKSVDFSADGCISIAKAVSCTLKENMQDQVSAQLQMYDLFRSELQQTGSALFSLLSGLEAPVAYIMTDSSAAAGPGFPVPGIALSASVKDRAVLSEGWEQLKASIDAAGMKLAGMPNMSAMLPIVPRSISGASNYTMLIPFLPCKLEPQVTVNDKDFIFSTSSTLNDRLVAEKSAAGIPFSGTVLSLHISPLVNLLQSAPPYDKNLKALSDVVEAIHSVQTIENGVMITTGLIELKR